MTYKNVTLNLIVLAFIGIALWSTILSYRSEKKTLPIDTSLPDAFMENVNAMVMDKEGKLKLKIIAPKLIHFIKDDSTKLISPQLSLYRKTPVPWLVTAKFALAKQGADHIDFWDDVQINHPIDQNQPATLIKTQQLFVHTREQRAETAELITMIQPNFNIQAKGMKAYMDSGNINLLSQVRGQYVPN